MTTAEPAQNRMKDPLIPFIVARFKRGAIVCHYGYEDDDKPMQRAGINATKQAVKILDGYGPQGRNPLVPLLDDQDPAIRVFAAGYLVKVYPQLALAVLNQIDQFCTTLAHRTASDFLWRHKCGELNL